MKIERTDGIAYPPRGLSRYGIKSRHDGHKLDNAGNLVDG